MSTMPKYCIIFTRGVNQQSMSVEFTHKPVVMQAGAIRHTVKGSPENMDLAAGISFLSHIWPEILVLPV